tara:strand:- start:81 stop:410 length:330 start_codon:yes stop_codon:yes gene_type:complete
MFKVYTNQDIDYVEQYLEEKGLDYSYKNYAFYIDDPARPDKTFQYYYTTGRWGVLYNRRNLGRKHYCCKDIETLVTKYIFEDKEIVSNKIINKIVKSRIVRKIVNLFTS